MEGFIYKYIYYCRTCGGWIETPVLSLMSLCPVELTVLCFPVLILLSRRFFFPTRTVKSFYHFSSCVQLCPSLNTCYRRNRVRRGTAWWIWLKKRLYFPWFLVVKSFLAAGKGAPIMFLSLFQSFSALICFSCWVIIIAAAAAPWLL